MFDTIAAISAGFVNEPIAIIRLSGPDAFKLVQNHYEGKVGKHRTFTYGRIVDAKGVVDEVLVAWFKAPSTYTGEDMVEINAHGGVVNSNSILRLMLGAGARLAERGEFSRRAFLNGKIDLVKAEAIHDLIFANTEEAARLHVQKFDGRTSSLINALQAKLLTFIATIETNIDYPEYDDVAVLTQRELLPALAEVASELALIQQSARSSRHLYEGLRVAIVGKPNVGKSSLLNALINEDKAIVTATPGTTRDVVEGRVQIGPMMLLIQDTAGIRQATDEVEQLGIAKSLATIERADLVIHLLDASAPYDEADAVLAKASALKTYLPVFNKADLAKRPGINISALKGELTPLVEAILALYPSVNVNQDYLVTNTRQLAYIDQASAAVAEAISALKANVEPSIVIIDIRAAWEALASILGHADQNDLLDLMFKHFCLGK